MINIYQRINNPAVILAGTIVLLIITITASNIFFWNLNTKPTAEHQTADISQIMLVDYDDGVLKYPPFELAETQRDNTTAFVTKVISGNSISVATKDSVEFLVTYLGITLLGEGLNKPELLNAAREFNRSMVEGKKVYLIKDQSIEEYDNVLLRYVYADGIMVNEALILAGHAAVSQTPDHFKWKERFHQAIPAPGLRSFHDEPLYSDKGTPVQKVYSPNRAIGGTLPNQQEYGPKTQCDYSVDSSPTIKGRIDPKTGEKTYYTPYDEDYSYIVVGTVDGDRWICSELAAREEGWRN